MTRKYRVLNRKNKYRVQEKGLLFWNDMVNGYLEPIYFYSQPMAESFIKTRIDLIEEKTKKWDIVTEYEI